MDKATKDDSKGQIAKQIKLKGEVDARQSDGQIETDNVNP